VVVVNKRSMVRSSLLIATSNQGKFAEITTLLADTEFELRSLSHRASTLPEPEETGTSFAENAQLKARFYAEKTGLLSLADDSGLSVLALDNFPGIHSARWTGPSDSDRVKGLLTKIQQETANTALDRRAFFTCVVSIASPQSGETNNFIGEVYGTLSTTPKGSEGFGYDPIFIADGQTKTMAQLGIDIKNTISARAIALAKARSWLLHYHP